MTIEEVIYKLLTDTVTDVPVYPLVAPQSQEVPYIIYQRTNTESFSNLSGGDSLKAVTFTVDVYHESFASLKQIASQIKTLHGFRGKIIINSEDFYIHMLTIEEENDNYYIEEGKEKGIFETEFSFLVYFLEV